MIKAIFYKEWIKTRWYLLLAFVVSMGFAIYAMLRISRVCSLKGVDHLWVVMMQRDAIFVELLQYVPMILGLILAIVQFAPEMHHRSFKLTLHLPIRATKALASMLSFGMMVLLLTFLPALLLMWGYLQTILAPELYWHILLSVLPWYLAGVAAYLLACWVALEPTWGRRVSNLVIGILLLRMYFLAPAPEAYNEFLPLLVIVTLSYSLLSVLSLTRFRDGRQD
ncbi:MAG: hypothetical protein IKU79_00590 [Bacteroidaceae bacterium]|nr:hypothetical protein [Bacteroidaceae bacterium]